MRKQFLITLATLIICFSVSAQSWYIVDSPADRELKTIQFISDDIGFIGGDSVLLKTVDGGITWNEIISDFENSDWPQSLDVLDLHFFDEDHGYVMSGLYGAMLETFDGGITWTSVAVASGFCQPVSLYFENENYGFAGGAGCFEGHIIGKYVDGTWTQTEDPQDWSGTNYVTTINFKNSDLGIAGTIGGTILRTTDGGDVWDTIPNLAEGHPITGIDFDVDLIRVSHHNVSQFGSMISSDDGLTWEYDTELASFFYPQFNALHTTEDGTAYAAGKLSNNDFVDGVIFEKQELSWIATPTLYNINDLGSHSGSSVFAVGEFGAIYTNREEIANGIEDLQIETINIYPNPSNGEFTVECFDSKVRELTLQNNLGQTVWRQKVSSPGVSVELNVPVGVYMLTENGQFLKKLVVE